MWVVVAAWVLCLASLSLPWPGYTLIVLLCCVAFFELASPTAWVATARGGGNNPAAAGRTPSTIDMSDTRKATAIPGPPPPPPAAATEATAVASYARCSPSVAFAGVIRYLASHLRRRGGGEIEEVVTTQVGSGDDQDDDHALRKEQQEQSKTAKKKPSATFLKGSVGSFSRGGLMVTHEGRVIYKVNQDRGLISHPSLNRAKHTVFGVFDGHGENGEHVAAYTMREVPRRLELHPESIRDPVSALEDVFLGINSSLPKSGINAVFGGCTAVVALVRGPRVWVANAGDSRALVAGRGEDGLVVARGLTRDQNPDSPGERERIEAMGGFVSDPEEAGASARVWLDATKTLVGLAMARSIGDLAVKRVGVIALPEVTEYVLQPEDEFLVLASDGVWEFIDNQEAKPASEIVQGFFDRGEDAAGACKGLMEMANRRWSDMVGDYRDDITATVVKLPFLPPAAAAEALVMNVASANEGDATAASAVAAGEEEAAAVATTSSPSAAAGEEVENRSDGAEVEDSGARDTADPDGGSSGDALVGQGGATGTELQRDGGYEDQERGHGAAVAAVAGRGGAAVSGGLTPTTEGATRADVSQDKDGGGGDHDEAGNNVKGFSEIPEEALAARMAGEDGSPAPLLAPAFSPALPTAAAGTRESVKTYDDDDDDDDDDDEADASTQVGAEFFDDMGEDDGEGLGEEEGEEGEEWEWEFGARENRQPSREIREASKEFPSGSLDALVAGADSSSPRTN
ncbi:unnamed protein product [Ectocarpus sp. CCAP 1310/34]|nr:unnamed protein product [Ectocarpus sp. CCAP 1310/34]